MIWPRSAILHSAAASSVEGICRIDGLHRRRAPPPAVARCPAHAPGRSRSARCRDLFLQRRRDVDGGIGNQQRARIARHVHQIDVADPPFGAQAASRRHDRMHAVHRCAARLSSAARPRPLAPAPRPAPRQRSCQVRRRAGSRRCPRLRLAAARILLPARSGSARSGPPRRLHGRQQRRGIDRMHDRRRHRLRRWRRGQASARMRIVPADTRTYGNATRGRRTFYVGARV